MKIIIAFVLVAFAAIANAGYFNVNPYSYLGYNAAFQAPVAVPYALTQHSYNTFAPNYQLKLDTTLPGSAYASYPYAAAPTAYGYGVLKAL